MFEVVTEIGGLRELIVGTIVQSCSLKLLLRLFFSFDCHLAELHELGETGIFGFESALNLLELFLEAETFFREPRKDDVVGLAHLNGLIVVDHSFVEAVAQAADLAHHWVVVVRQI